MGIGAREKDPFSAQKSEQTEAAAEGHYEIETASTLHRRKRRFGSIFTWNPTHKRLHNIHLYYVFALSISIVD